MALTRRSLKGLIEFSDLRNVDGVYTKDDVIGVSTDKCMISTKADLDGVNLLNYKLFSPGCFAFVADTSRRGDKIALAYNNTEQTFIVSTWYVVFRVCDEARDIISSDYLYMYFNRAEFDRYARFNSWGSAREYFWFSDMENIIMEIPPLPVQQKYVDVYNSMLANQRNYERGLEDLKKAVFAEIDIIKHSARKVTVGDLLEEIDSRNADGSITNIQGINIEKQFMLSVADTASVNIRNYKVLREGQFAYSSMQTGRDKCIRIALYDKDTPALISPAYSVLRVKEPSAVAEYIMLWFTRPETDRYGWFASDASVRANLDLDRFYEIQIPMPDTAKQQAIANIYIAYMLRREINEQLKAQIRDICPILIKGSLEEARTLKI